MDYFYHGHVRSIVGVFGSLFNDITIARKEADGSLSNQRLVPIAYGPRQKFLTRIEERPELPSANVAIKLPRISYEMKDLSYDPSRQKQKQHFDVLSTADGPVKLWRPVPWKMQMTVSVMTKNQDEGLQIVEQILPMFSPSLGFKLKPIAGHPSIIDDVKVTLAGNVGIEDQYEGDFTTRRVLIYTINFEVIFNLYRRIPSSGAPVIKTVTINYRDNTTEDLIKATTLAVNPSNAEEDDVWTVDITEIDGFDE